MKLFDKTPTPDTALALKAMHEPLVLKSVTSPCTDLQNMFRNPCDRFPVHFRCSPFLDLGTLGDEVMSRFQKNSMASRLVMRINGKSFDSREGQIYDHGFRHGSVIEVDIRVEIVACADLERRWAIDQRFPKADGRMSKMAGI